MRRADRLFQIIQILRRQGGPVTAEVMAAELETSKRTVYRDVADLIGQRVPIRGEAGTGYVLEQGFDLPPLMLTADEVEAAVLGAQWVAANGDAALAVAARDLMAKIAATVPETLRPLVEDPAARAYRPYGAATDGLDLAEVRRAIRDGRKVRLSYCDKDDQLTERTVWPAGIGYTDATRILIAWCELRSDFRSFRADRVTGAQFLEERYPERPSVLRHRWRKKREAEWASCVASGAAPKMVPEPA
jgi:predicted DNA-binding transcriptional regulator YafY